MEAVWYQICVDRFYNGDTDNDPTRASLDQADQVPENWTKSKVGQDWYSRNEWESAMGSAFIPEGLAARRYGGDLQGIIDRLDYLQFLGINALHLGGIYFSGSFDRNIVRSWHHVDPFLGPDPDGDFALMAGENEDPVTWKWTSADKLFLKLIQEAHDRGMHILLDVTWHEVDVHFFTRNLSTNRIENAADQYKNIQLQSSIAQQYEDWFTVDSAGIDQQKSNRTLKLALSENGRNVQQAAKLYIFHCTRRWMDPDGDGLTYDGVDGWHVRQADQLPAEFWMDWNSVVRLLNLQSLTLCTVEEESARFVAGGKFTTSQNLRGFGIPAKGFILDSALEPSRFLQMVQANRRPYPPHLYHQMQNVLESLDTSRLASLAQEALNPDNTAYDKPAVFDFYPDYSADSIKRLWYQSVVQPTPRARRLQKLAIILQMTFAGAPVVLYGSETGLWGSAPGHNCKPVLWAGQKGEEDKGGEPSPLMLIPEAGRDLASFYQRAIYLRHAVEAFQKGNMQPMIVDDAKNTLIYARFLDNIPYLVAINRSENTVTETFTLRGIAPDLLKNYQLLLHSGDDSDPLPVLEIDESTITVTLLPLTGLIAGLDPFTDG